VTDDIKRARQARISLAKAIVRQRRTPMEFGMHMSWSWRPVDVVCSACLLLLPLFVTLIAIWIASKIYPQSGQPPTDGAG
jgi:hypothetical protein